MSVERHACRLETLAGARDDPTPAELLAAQRRVLDAVQARLAAFLAGDLPPLPTAEDRRAAETIDAYKRARGVVDDRGARARAVTQLREIIRMRREAGVGQGVER